ncbi:hypothetical protein VNO78_21317 [Psophocarpus tetragonolobus]|uniref:Rx N-terminal domain-containing protein n=1 Tax=Psophocarpus tetragonolobus TaxID=3891 RepID=A0AAN9SBG5_PSOTE
MAESILFAVAESLIGKLTSEVVQETSLALGVYHDLQEMKETMTLIKAVMLDAEQKRLTNNALSEWLRRIKRVFSDAEDIVDDFECEALRKHVVKTYGSCSRKICRFFSSSNKISTRGLFEEDSFSLFVKLAFKEGEEKQHPQLLEIGRELVKKCGGIPLAVTTLGSSLISRMRNPALQLSYDRLPSHLKRCFASFSFFEEDSEFSSLDVIMLWKAYGFLPPPKKSETINDVANQFLRELISRSFLTDFFHYGNIVYFKLHDLVRDLAVYVDTKLALKVSLQ